MKPYLNPIALSCLCVSLCALAICPLATFSVHIFNPSNCRAPFLCIISQSQLKPIFVNGSHRLGLQTPADNESSTHGNREKKIRLRKRALYVPAHTYTDLFFLFLSLCFSFRLKDLKSRKSVIVSPEKYI